MKIGDRIVTSQGQVINFFIPSETPALQRLQSFWVAINAFYVDEDRLPLNQTELSSYMNFSSTDYYDFSFTSVHSGLCYFQATANHNLINSYTRTVVDEGVSFEEIICKKIGKVAPGPANYSGGNLSCQIGTTEFNF